MIELTNLKELEKLFKESSSREELDSVFKAWRTQYTLPIREKIKKTHLIEEKKILGLQLKTLTEQAQKLYESKKLEFSGWNIPFYEARELKIEQISEDYKLNYSSKNLLSEVFESVYKFLETNNFYFYEESEIVKVKENFDFLLIPETHPARAESDSYFLSNIQLEKLTVFSRFNKYLKNSSKSLMLRTHTTTSTLKLLKKYKGQKFLGASMGNVYRKEDNDSTHLSQFNQLDLVWVDKQLELTHLKELIENLLISLLFDKCSEFKNYYRLRPSYFPFTSPSFEVDLECNCKKSKDCCLCKGTGWVELLGCGFLRPEILEKTHSNYVAIALGIGLERLAILKHRIKDVRDLYKNNFSNLITPISI